MGEKVVWKDGGDIPLQSGREGHVAAFLCGSILNLSCYHDSSGGKVT